MHADSPGICAKDERSLKAIKHRKSKLTLWESSFMTLYRFNRESITYRIELYKNHISLYMYNIPLTRYNSYQIELREFENTDSLKPCLQGKRLFELKTKNIQ